MKSLSNVFPVLELTCCIYGNLRVALLEGRPYKRAANEKVPHPSGAPRTAWTTGKATGAGGQDTR